MANKIYTVTEELITFQDSGGSAVITLANLAATTGGRISARWDRGTGAKPGRARLWGKFQMETAGVLGELILVYLVQWSSHGTPLGAGAMGTADAALTGDQARNMGDPALIVQVDKITTATDIVGCSIVDMTGRYISVAVRNITTDPLKNTANANQVSLEFLPDEIQ